MPEATQTQQDLSNELDETLLAAVKLAKTQATAEDTVPNAAILNAAINRLKALGITKVIGEDDAAADLAKECGLTPETLKFPDISTEPANTMTGSI